MSTHDAEQLLALDLELESHTHGRIYTRIEERGLRRTIPTDYVCQRETDAWDKFQVQV